MPLAAGLKKLRVNLTSPRTRDNRLQRVLGSHTRRRKAWPRMSRRSARLLAAGGISYSDALRLNKQGLVDSSRGGPNDCKSTHPAVGRRGAMMLKKSGIAILTYMDEQGVQGSGVQE
jgi:hypothetical protein